MSPTAMPFGTQYATAALVGAGLFSAGPARIVESKFVHFNYGATSKPLVWLVRFERPDEPAYDQPYGIGDGWQTDATGRTLKSTSGKENLPVSCNAVKYLIASLEKAGGQPVMDLLAQGDPALLVGMEVIVDRVVQEARDFRDKSKERLGPDGKPKVSSILIITAVTALPGAKPAKGKKSAPPAASAPAPAAKAKRAPVVDDDDEDDDAPAPSAAADEDLREEAEEALIAVLEEGPLKARDLEAELLKYLGTNPQAKALAAYMTDPASLARTNGWTVSANGKVLSIA